MTVCIQMTHSHCLSWNIRILTNFLLSVCVANQGSCLSPPPSGSKLVAVALGVGTQNYTCSSSTAAPTPNGAFAILYDISCTVATVPSAAHYLSALALKADVFTDYPIRSSMGYTTIGIHYFEPSTKSAVFEFDLNNKSYKFIGRRLENIPAPNQAAEGSVDWLKLGRTPGFERQSHNVKVGKIPVYIGMQFKFLTSMQKWVYRVLTAGGKAPNTCEGLPKEHTVNYATEYCE